MHSMRKGLTTAAVAVLFGATLLVATPQTSFAETSEGFDDQYVFATTKAVNDMQGINPALKLTLYPVTIVLDTAFLPFAIIAGYVT